MTTIPSSRQSLWQFVVRMAVLISTIIGSSVTTLSAGVIGYTFTPLGPNEYQYTYSVSGFALSKNQEIYIQFDQSVYLTLFNGQAPAAFSLVLTEPNNPPGTPGGYSALALTDSPSLAGPFSVDVSFLAGSGTGASQPYFVDQFDSQGHLTSQIASGNTVDIVPEPSTIVIGLTLVPLCFAYRFARRRH